MFVFSRFRSTEQQFRRKVLGTQLFGFAWQVPVTCLLSTGIQKRSPYQADIGRLQHAVSGNSVMIRNRNTRHKFLSWLARLRTRKRLILPLEVRSETNSETGTNRLCGGSRSSCDPSFRHAWSVLLCYGGLVQYELYTLTDTEAYLDSPGRCRIYFSEVRVWLWHWSLWHSVCSFHSIVVTKEGLLWIISCACGTRSAGVQPECRNVHLRGPSCETANGTGPSWSAFCSQLGTNGRPPPFHVDGECIHFVRAYFGVLCRMCENSVLRVYIPRRKWLNITIL
jgi:hypothetical protein